MKHLTLTMALLMLAGACLGSLVGCGGNATTPAVTTSGITDAVTTETPATEAPETDCPHSYETTVTDPTCTAAGAKVTACTLCGDVSDTVAIPKADHDWEVVETPASLTENGTSTATCRVCGTVKTETVTAMTDGVVVDTVTEHVVAKENGYVYLDIESPLLSLGGIAAPSANNGELFRFNSANKSAYPEDIQREGATTAGATLRFRVYGGTVRLKATRRTDVAYVERATYDFDVYLGTGTNRYLWKTLSSDFNKVDYLSEELVLPEGVQEVMICLPRTVGFSSLQVGIREGAYVSAPPARKGGAVAFYGSSITQGYTASSPSLSYAMKLCLELDADCVNFGLSGAARGEKAVIDDMCAKITDAGISVFILDYDWNINSSTELREGSAYWNSYPYATIYGKIRDAVGADAPIVMLSRPFFGRGTAGITGAEVTKCIRVIEGACEDAIEAGDNNVIFVSGKTFFPEEEQTACHVGDQVHPSDLGHNYMKKAVMAALEQLSSAS
jgi:hypothetical protein